MQSVSHNVQPSGRGDDDGLMEISDFMLKLLNKSKGKFHLVKSVWVHKFCKPNIFIFIISFIFISVIFLPKTVKFKKQNSYDCLG